MFNKINSHHETKPKVRDVGQPHTGPYQTLMKLLYNRIRYLNVNKQLSSKVIATHVDGYITTLTSDYSFLRSYANTMGVTKWKLYIKKNWHGLGKDFTSAELLRACFRAALTYDLSREFNLVFDGKCVL